MEVATLAVVWMVADSEPVSGRTDKGETRAMAESGAWVRKTLALMALMMSIAQRLVALLC